MAKYTPKRAAKSGRKLPTLFQKRIQRPRRESRDACETVQLNTVDQEAVDFPPSIGTSKLPETLVETAPPVSTPAEASEPSPSAEAEREENCPVSTADLPTDTGTLPEAVSSPVSEGEAIPSAASSSVETEDAPPTEKHTIILPGFHLRAKQEKPHARLPLSIHSKRGKLLLGMGTAAVLVIAYVILCAVVNPDVALLKTTINGTDVSGLDQTAMTKLISADFEANYTDKTLTVSASGKKYTVSMGPSLGLDADAVAKGVLSRSGSAFLKRGWHLIRNAITGDPRLAIPEVTDSDALDQAIEESGLLEIDTTTQTTYELTEENLVFTMGKTGQSVDKKGLVTCLENAVASDNYESTLECPMLNGSVKPVDIEAVYADIYQESSNATLDPKHDYQIVPSVQGIDFDKDAAAEAIAEASEGETVSIPVTRTDPIVSTKNLEDHLFEDVLGTYTTNVGGTSNRLKNVQKAASNINGTIMLSGDSFSYNETVGERTAANGFYTAGAYLNGATVQEYGGGVCQVSSTAYIAVVKANLEITERHNHSYVSSYVPLGMDATVSWGGPDFQFKNNRDYPIKIVTNYSSSNQLTVTIMGTNANGTTCDLVSEKLSWQDYATIQKEDPSMYVGESRKSVDGEPGATAQTYRVIYDKNGKQISKEKEAYSVYTKRDAVVYVGTKEKEVVKPADAEASGADGAEDEED